MSLKNTSIEAPTCEKKPERLEVHNDVRIDDYYWLNDRENEDVINYLKAENEYTDSVMAPLKKFEEDLFQEMKGRIKEQDESVPYRQNGFWYYTRTEEGKEYPIYCRKNGSMDADEEIMLNVNELAEGFAYYAIGGLAISPNNETLAYGVDTVSRRIYTIHFKNLITGENYEQTLENTTGSCTWAADNNHIFFSSKNEKTLRSDKSNRYSFSIYESEVIFEETDETYNSYVYKSK
jgi:oligopeptidase B